jgi:hypothetical protein
MRKSIISATILASLVTAPALAATNTPLANESGAAPAIRGTGHGNAADPMKPETNATDANNPSIRQNGNCAGDTTSPNMLASRWGRKC